VDWPAAIIPTEGCAMVTARVNREMLEHRVRELGLLQPWNHNFDLGEGIQTAPGLQRSHGKNVIKLERLKPLFDAIDLRDKRVLDIGCNEGFFALYMAAQGARVIGIDVDEQRIAKARFVQSLMGTADVDLRVTDIFSPDFAALPSADLCVCLGVIHRVPDPVAALSALAKKTDMLLLEWKALKFGPHDEAFAYFSAKPVDQDDYYGTEYWLPSFAAVERILVRLGFTHFHRVDESVQRRAILVAGRAPHPIFDMPDVNVPRNRIRSLLSHTKRYVRTVFGIITGRVNA
jgi:SAM-dependent methyltransferase